MTPLATISCYERSHPTAALLRAANHTKHKKHLTLQSAGAVERLNRAVNHASSTLRFTEPMNRLTNGLLVTDAGLRVITISMRYLSRLLD